MLYLVFEIGGEGYALPADRVVELLPYTEPKPMRDAPASVVGAISYRGEYLPVLDASSLELGRPAERRMGTRIAVVEVMTGAGTRQLGLILESATDMLRCNPEEFTPFVTGGRGLVQALDVESLLRAEIVDAIAKPVGACA